MSIPFLLLQAVALALPTESEVFAGVLHGIDQNGDGGIAEAEYARVDDATPFSSLDHDGDGNVDLAELTAFLKVTQPRPMDRPVPRPAAGGVAHSTPAVALASTEAAPGTPWLRWALAALGIAIATMSVIAIRAHSATRRPRPRRRGR